MGPLRVMQLALASTLLALTGCASQTAVDQVPPQATARLCDTGGCADVPRQTNTFQGEPNDPQAERRLQALVELARRDASAAYDLGLRYLRGDGVERNGYRAIEWLRRAGNAGHTEAQYALGRLYLSGFEEMGADPAEAEAWLTHTAAKNYRDARQLLADAQAAKQEQRRQYQAREEARKSLENWYRSAPYFWVWRVDGWHLR
jgi:TPR repeat protein